MSPRTRLILLAAGTITLVAVALIAVMGALRPAPVAPIPTPTPTFTAQGSPVNDGVESPEDAEANVDMQENLTQGEHDLLHPAVDLSAFRAEAVAVVQAYVMFDSAETAADREARLLAAGASVDISDELTGLALERHDGEVDWVAKGATHGQPYAAFVSQEPTTVTFDVITDYWGSYGEPERYSQQQRGIWTVTIEWSGDPNTPTLGQVIRIGEPDFPLS
ncbi:hypothetical protein [Rathayibacter rathayi]|uniref:hypothetical protein n=1 Tax=Rathayibacter rathayi TaxID=33887 RepID=UPI000CE92AEF|nr:hypothetical protein [Rathayibacter rathayi]PPG14382.1 hypothetical protein C5C11_04925 [Rathayibacter rathayi]